MRTPKEIFLTSGYADAFSKIVQTEAFESACQFAIMQLRAELPQNLMPGLTTDPLIGFDANAQMVGAARLIDILQSLPQKQEDTPPKRETLNYANPSSPHRRQANH